MNRRRFTISAIFGGVAAAAGAYSPLVNLLDNFIRQRIETVTEADLEKMLANINERKKIELSKHVDGIKKNLVDLYTITDFVIQPYGKTKIMTSEKYGGGLIYKDYILTVNHVSSDSKSDFVERVFGNFPLLQKKQIAEKLVYEKMGEITLLGRKTLEKLVEIPDKDLAVLKLPKDYSKSSYQVKLGDSDQMKFPDKVFLIGNPKREGVATRPGIIGSNELIKYLDLPSKGMVASMSSEDGDSGNPLINENGEVIGLVYAAIGSAYTLFIPSNRYKEEISKYEKSQKK